MTNKTPEDSALVPQTRAGRHALISAILTHDSVTSQADLAEALAERGVRVTQATLSRDLDVLRATKVRTPDGGAVYRLPEDGEMTGTLGADEDAVTENARLRRWCTDLLIAGEVAQNIAVLRTPPGAAGMLGSALDHSVIPGVLGSVAGDDTIIVVTRDNAAATEFVDYLLTLAHQGRHTTHD